MGHLTDAFLAWNHYGMPSSLSEGEPMDSQWSLLVIDVLVHTPYSKLYLNSVVTNLQLFQDCSSCTFVHMSGYKYTNETLVRHGIIGGSPEKVSIGISVRALEAYRQLHRVCPRLSIQAFSMALCHLHEVRLPCPFLTAHN